VGRAGRVLIVNADDFGRTRSINEGIAMAHERGIVTSASLMVRWDAAEHAADYAHAHTGLSVGLHVDLGQWSQVRGTWTADYEVVPTDDACAVDVEIRRQLARFVELLGHAPTHLDSHQHVHRREPVRSILRAVGRELGAPVRHMSTIIYCGAFYGRDATNEPMLDAISANALSRIIAGLPDGSTELCCHPATRSDDPAYGSERVLELAALCDSGVADVIASEGVMLHPFPRLARSA
jgi:chitin disaccharide deacetylase